jgi:hypothetical protein
VSDTPRPEYVSYGWCNNGHMDVKLYRVPGTKYAHALLCKGCLAELGYAEPKPRTAEDIEEVNGELRWKSNT